MPEQVKSLLQEADEIINGPRADAYGSAIKNYQTLAQVWSALLGIPITYQQVIQCMVGVKLVRINNTPDHKDSWLDIAGYAGVWEKANKDAP